MLDDMFSFIDFFVEPMFDELAQYTTEDGTLFDSQEKTAKRAGITRRLTEEDYRQMWMLRYQQHLGSVSFFEMLDKYEEILGIPPRLD